MYAFRTLLVILAFSLASVFAAPTHRRRSGRCRAPTVSSSVAESTVSSTVATSTAVGTVVASTSAASTHASTSTHKTSSSSHQSTITSAKPSATSTTSSDNGNNGTSGLLKKLFPVAHTSSSWTTSTSSGDALPLDDGTLGVNKLLSALSHNYVTAPDGKTSMQAHYPEGSYTFGHQPEGGLSFYAKGPKNFDLDNAKEVTFSYSVLFEDDFDFNKGGKLPGVCECFMLLSGIFVPPLGS